MDIRTVVIFIETVLFLRLFYYVASESHVTLIPFLNGFNFYKLYQLSVRQLCIISFPPLITLHSLFLLYTVYVYSDKGQLQ